MDRRQESSTVTAMAKSTNNSKQRVTGIGGIFFLATDPVALAAWYQKHLGIETKDGTADFQWQKNKNPRQPGRTVWAIFPKDTDYFGPNSPAFMINYRVANLDRLIAQLRRARIKVEKIQQYDYGRFAWVTDPEGNRIELWEPVE